MRGNEQGFRWGQEDCLVRDGSIREVARRVLLVVAVITGEKTYRKRHRADGNQP